MRYNPVCFAAIIAVVVVAVGYWPNVNKLLEIFQKQMNHGRFNYYHIDYHDDDYEDWQVTIRIHIHMNIQQVHACFDMFFTLCRV